MADVSLKAPIIGNKSVEREERSELIQRLQQYRRMRAEWIRRQVLQNNRVDILATMVLGYEVKPFHLAMMAFQFHHADTLQLAFRGAGKSTVCTITKAIHLLLKDPNLRILIASKTANNAESFLKEVKAHFEGNDALTEIFGAYYDSRKSTKWDNREIEVLPRTSRAKEASITCVGVEGTIVGKHYDVILSDDLCDEENTRTEYMREKTRVWYYQTLDPTLEPPSADVPHRGEHHRLGTRYHYADLWGHLIDNELKHRHQRIKSLNDDGQTPWPEKYPPEWFQEKRRRAGIIIFNAQYQCDTEAMKGEIFQYDNCQPIETEDLPQGLKIYMGIDLAISEKDKADHFAAVVIGMDDTKNRYVLDYFEEQLRFSAQTAKILELYRLWKPIRAAIEVNAYQDAQYQTLKDSDPDVRLLPIHQSKDKITRAQKLSALFEDNKMWFKKGGNRHLLVEQLVLFPNVRYKDGFDALDLAVTASKRKTRRKPRREPGVI